MRILVSLENDQNLQKLCLKLCSFLSIIEDEEIFIDILHVYNPPGKGRASEMEDVLKEIRVNEHKMRIRMISSCENTLENHLLDNLNKRSLVNSYILEGDYQERLEKHLVFHTYDLLILNPGKKNEFLQILRGRNTHWAIDNLEVPVLILPNYLDIDKSHAYEVTCFIDELKTFKNVNRSDLFQKFHRSKLKFVHFGRTAIDDDVEVIHSSNPLESITDHTKAAHSNNVFVLNHKNKGNYMNFLDKSFTKNVILSLQNPLLIF